MASCPQVIEAFAPVIGRGTAALDRDMRELRLAGLIPVSGKGGGRVAVHFRPVHMAAVILSTAAGGPNGVVAAVRDLGRLRRANAPQQGNLQAILTETITNVAATLKLGRNPLPGNRDWQLTLALEPPAAWITWNGETPELPQFFVDAQADLLAMAPNVVVGVRRLTAIGPDVLIAAARLCVETIETQETEARSAA